MVIGEAAEPCAFATSGAARARRLYNEWIRVNESDTVVLPTTAELDRWQVNFTDKIASRACATDECTLSQAVHAGPYSRVPLINLCDLRSFGVLRDMAHPDPQRKLACSTPALQSEDCVVVSVGSENIWHFEQAVFTHTRCRVHVFDCTTLNNVSLTTEVAGGRRLSNRHAAQEFGGREWAVPSALRSRVQLHRKCLGKPQYKTWGHQLGTEHIISWPQLLDLIGLGRRPPALLKIDCEGCEVQLFRELMDSQQQDLLPEQIAVELHSSLRIDTGRQRPWRARALNMYADLHARWPVPQMLAELHKRAGFTVAGGIIGESWAGWCCTETLLVRTHCLGSSRHPCRTIQESICKGHGL